LDLDPKDATLALDGHPIGFDPDGTLSVLAGTHTLRAERSGFDPAEATLAVGAGGTLELALRLSPNARTVVVVCEPAGAEVLLDGRPVGVRLRLRRHNRGRHDRRPEARHREFRYRHA
jgi:hypothetical protein